MLIFVYIRLILTDSSVDKLQLSSFLDTIYIEHSWKIIDKFRGGELNWQKGIKRGVS